MITPPPAELVLSAQARTEYVPLDRKVYAGEVAVAVPLAARVVIVVAVKSVIVPPPFTKVALWKKLLKLAPVEAVPLLVIVAVNVCATPTVAVDGEETPAVRFGVPPPPPPPPPPQSAEQAA